MLNIVYAHKDTHVADIRRPNFGDYQKAELQVLQRVISQLGRKRTLTPGQGFKRNIDTFLK